MTGVSQLVTAVASHNITSYVAKLPAKAYGESEKLCSDPRCRKQKPLMYLAHVKPCNHIIRQTFKNVNYTSLPYFMSFLQIRECVSAELKPHGQMLANIPTALVKVESMQKGHGNAKLELLTETRKE